MARAHGLQDLEIDGDGQRHRHAPRRRQRPADCVAAHLDTVFPPGTPIKVRREGTKLFAPGIGDDTRSLAVLLAWLRALDAAAMRTRADILFVADVGEEGLGDLRGMRHLFQRGRYKDRISAFITVDSPDMEHIVTGGVGSKRYRVTFSGPGGHSYGAFGLVNPMYAMADAISRLAAIPVPTRPKTTFSASVTGGGTSINAIPNSVWAEVRPALRGAGRTGPAGAALPGVVQEAVAAENAARSTTRGAIAAELKQIGDRPAGVHDGHRRTAATARAALAAHGFHPLRGRRPPTPTSR